MPVPPRSDLGGVVADLEVLLTGQVLALFLAVPGASFASITKGVQIETETLPSRSKPKHLRSSKLGPAWALGPEDRNNIETELPNHVEFESIELRPTLLGAELCNAAGDAHPRSDVQSSQGIWALISSVLVSLALKCWKLV